MDLYELLGVRKAATGVEIRRAYQKRARQLHPDLNPGDPISAERFRQVTVAFEVLSNGERRADYDRHGRVGSPAPPDVPEVGFAGFDFSAERGRTAGFREIFDGALASDAAAVEATRGEDLEQATRLAFDEAFHGTRRRIHLVRQDACQACGGSGEVALGPVACPKCGGSGQVRARRGHMLFTRRCAACGATGRIDRRPCARCAGEGRLIQSEWLEVDIPPGVGHGSRVAVEGCGNAGRRGGRPGDFVLVVEVEAHPFFRREGDDLRCGVPVTFAEAALGAHVDVPTPTGTVAIEIPAGTQTGQEFRLRKRGMPKLGEKGRGDLYVEVDVRTPRLADERSRELLRELARLNPEDPRRGLPQPSAPAEKG
jgi:molecular chaperone DnaJ